MSSARGTSRLPNPLLRLSATTAIRSLSGVSRLENLPGFAPESKETGLICFGQTLARPHPVTCMARRS